MLRFSSLLQVHVPVVSNNASTHLNAHRKLFLHVVLYAVHSCAVLIADRPQPCNSR